MPSFIRRHKWLTTILSIIFIGLPQYIDSVWSLAEKISGRQLTIPNVMWIYWITVPLGMTMLSVAIWAIKSNESSDKQSKDIPKRTERILIQIHNRMLELKDKAVQQYYSTHSLVEFSKLHNTIMSTYNKKTDLTNLKKSWKGRRFSKDTDKKRLQLDNLLVQLKPISPTVKSLDELVKFVNKIDRLAEIPRKEYQYKGLDIRRNEDKRWNKLFNKLQEIKIIFNDNILNNMIDEYIQWSKGISGLIWLTDLFRKMSVTDLPTEYLESEAYNPIIETNNVMTRLRGDIFKRIKELQSMNDETDKTDKTIIKDTKVKLDVQKVDKATGMNIDNVQTELSNVQIDVEAKDVREATGLSVTSRNTEFALSSTVIICSCGNRISSVTTCGYKPVIKCPQCGKEYND